MKFLIGAILFSLLAVPAAFAAKDTPAQPMMHVPPSGFVAACRSRDEPDHTGCVAVLRGTAEQLQTLLVKGKFACREKPFSADDVGDFVKYASSHMIPDTGEGAALAANFWISNLGNVPCDGVPGYWTAGYLLSLCTANHEPGSVCSLYWKGVLMIVHIENAAGGAFPFCPKGNTIRSQDVVYGGFHAWVVADPDRANAPAAVGFVEAMKTAYPC